MHSGDHDILTSFVAATTVSMTTLENKIDAVILRLDTRYVTNEEYLTKHQAIVDIQIDHEKRVRINEVEIADQKIINGNMMGKIILGTTLVSLVMTIVVGIAIAWIKKSLGL
jgi:uncharacterized protein YheU (UPF0270 family)